MSENSLNKPFILPSAASFFASFVASSQYVKQSKHLLNLKKKENPHKQMHTYSSFHAFLAFVSLHYNATLNMVRTSFLKLIKPSNCIVRCKNKCLIEAKT